MHGLLIIIGWDELNVCLYDCVRAGLWRLNQTTAGYVGDYTHYCVPQQGKRYVGRVLPQLQISIALIIFPQCTSCLVSGVVVGKHSVTPSIMPSWPGLREA